jgi:plastocyanin
MEIWKVDPMLKPAVSATLLSLCLSGAAAAQPAPSVDWQKAQMVEVVMTNYAFTPKSLRLRRGVPYRLHFVNSGSSGHDFTAPEFLSAVLIAPDDRAKVDGDEIEVAEGQSVDVKMVPERAGAYAFHCSHFLHSMFGMHGEAVVE